MKTCTKCKQPKPTRQMSVRKRAADGMSSTCKECDRLAVAKWRKENPLKSKTSKDNYNRLNKESNRKRAENWRIENRDRDRLNANNWYHANASRVRNRKLVKTYGITELDYLTLLLKQQHRCAICRSEISKCHSNRFHVDHCHETNKVRGLLCTTCNTALGKFHDSPDILRNAIAYLEKHAE